MKVYNGKVILSYVNYLKSNKSEVDIIGICINSGIYPEQLGREDYWISREKIDRFHSSIIAATGNLHIARDVGMFTSSHQTLGMSRRFLLSSIGIEKVLELSCRTSHAFNRASEFKFVSHGKGRAEIIVTPLMQENQYSCENRFGFYQGLSSLWADKCKQISVQHTECVFKGGRVCKYQFMWDQKKWFDFFLNPKTKETPCNDFLGTELTGIALLDGKCKLVGMSQDNSCLFQDGNNQLHNIIYPYLIDLPILKDAIDEFEYLINDRLVTESKLHNFFERNPEFILNNEHSKAYSKIILQDDSGKILIPDFVLEPCDTRGLCDLLEIKKPIDKLYVNKENRIRFTSNVAEAVAQLREYEHYFDEKSHRNNVYFKYGLNIYKPKMFLIIGRSGSAHPMVRRKAELDYPSCVIKTYDDILLHMKRRIDW